MRKQKLKLGDIQQEVLAMLYEHKAWHAGCGWIWDNVSRTKKILESLRKHGLVDFCGQRQIYVVSNPGVDHLKTIRPYLFKK